MATALPEHSSTTSTAPATTRPGSAMVGTTRSPGWRTAVAPTARASAWRRSPGSAQTTSSTPSARSAAMVSAPIGPAPSTSTRWPGRMPDRVMPCSATASGSARAAARGSRPAGSGSSSSAGVSL